MFVAMREQQGCPITINLPKMKASPMLMFKGEMKIMHIFCASRVHMNTRKHAPQSLNHMVKRKEGANCSIETRHLIGADDRIGGCDLQHEKGAVERQDRYVNE